MDNLVSPVQMAASAALGAFIGYSTNFLAIRSLFRPLEPKWYTLGWQGVIPKNRARLADNVALVVGEELLYREYLVAQIERPALQESLRQELEELRQEQSRLRHLLDDRKTLLDTLVSELKQLRKRYATPRRTALQEGGDELVAQRTAAQRPNTEMLRKQALANVSSDQQLLWQSDGILRLVTPQVLGRLHLLDDLDFGDHGCFD